MCAFYENQFKVCVEFLRASQPGMGRIIRLNHSPAVVPPQLLGRIHPGFWQAFMEDVGQLSLRHPFTAKPTASNFCSWAACFGLGAVVGLFCISPDAGDYGAWEAECRQLVDRWAPGFMQAGCALTLQRNRDYWLQLDINPQFVVSQSLAPPLPPQAAAWAPPPPGAKSGQLLPHQQQQQPELANPPKTV